MCYVSKEVIYPTVPTGLVPAICESQGWIANHYNNEEKLEQFSFLKSLILEEEEDERKLYVNNQSHFNSIHFTIHYAVSY